MTPSSRIVGAAAAALFVLAASHAGAQSSAPSPTPAVTMWGPNVAGPMARVGNTLYLGGGFDYIGPPTGSLAIVDAADPTQINTTARLLNETLSVVADGTGGWFVAPLEQLGPGQGTLALKHILPSGGVDPNWTMPALAGGMIVQVFVDGSRLYIAGNFTAVGGVARQGLAALDVATGALLPFTTTRNVATIFPNVYVEGGFVYLAGLSTAGGGTVVLDGATGADVPFAATATFIMAASANRVYGFAQSLATNRIDAFDRAGVALPTWVSPTFFGELVHQVVAGASRVFVVSYSNNRARITAYDPLTGALLPSWSPPPFTVEAATNSLDVWTIRLDGNTLYVGGAFSAVDGQIRSRVAALDATTGALTSWAPLVGGRVTSLAVGQGRVAIGGAFSSAGGISRKYLAALDLTTGLPLDVVPPVTRPITAITASGDLVLAAEGGTTGSANTAGEVFGFSAASGVKYPAVLPFAGGVTVLEMAGTRLFMGGTFVFGPEPPRSLAAFDLAGGGLLPWNPVLGPNPNPINPGVPFPPRVNVIRARLGRLYVGGQFTSANGNSRGSGAAFDLGNLSLTGWDPRAPTVGGIEVWQSRMLIGGGSQALWVDPVSGNRLGVPLPATFSPVAIARAADTFIVGGSTSSTDPAASALAAIDARSGQPQPWPTGLITPVGFTQVSYALGFDDLVVAGGAFTVVGQQPAVNLAVFRTSPPAPPRNLTFDNGASAVTLAWTAAQGATPISYVIEAGTAPGLGDLGRFPVGSLTQVSAAVGSGSYALRVFAVGLTGTSAASSDVVFTRPAPAAPPAAPSGLSGSVTAGVVTLTWSASANATTYVIEGGSAPGLGDIGVLPTGVLDTNIAGAIPAGTYFFRVRAANQFGLGPVSNEVRVVVP